MRSPSKTFAGELKQEDCQFKGCRGYRVNSRPTRGNLVRSCPQIKK